jgi:hypothetical protein
MSIIAAAKAKNKATSSHAALKEVSIVRNLADFIYG